MRHRKTTVKLGRSAAHRDAMMANQACSLIKHERIKTTLAKAKALRPFAEKMVTLGKSGTLHARRLAAARLHQEDAVKKLFTDIAPRAKDRSGGYTRIVKLGARNSDATPMAFIEWVDQAAAVEEAAPEPKAKKAKKTPEEQAAPVAENPKRTRKTEKKSEE